MNSISQSSLIFFYLQPWYFHLLFPWNEPLTPQILLHRLQLSRWLWFTKDNFTTNRNRQIYAGYNSPPSCCYSISLLLSAHAKDNISDHGVVWPTHARLWLSDLICVDVKDLAQSRKKAFGCWYIWTTY